MELQKLFVLVPAGTKEFDGASVSLADASKLYFEQDKCTIWNRGVAYGMDPDKVKSLADIIALVGTKPEDWADSDTVISRLTENEELAARNENALSQVGMALTGYGDAAISEEVAKQWGDFNEEGDYELDGRKSILGSISALEAEDRVALDENEKILALSDNKVLSSALSIAIEKHAESDAEGAAEHEYIQLLGQGDVLVAEVEADKFVKDGMLKDAELVTEAEEGITEAVPYIKLTWNTDGGDKILRFSVKDLVDVYTSGDESTLKVEGYVITPVIAEGIYQDEPGLVTAGQVYAVKEEINDSLSMIGTVLVGNGDTYMDDETAARYFKSDEEGRMIPSDISALQDITDLRHAVNDWDPWEVYSATEEELPLA